MAQQRRQRTRRIVDHLLALHAAQGLMAERLQSAPLDLLGRRRLHMARTRQSLDQKSAQAARRFDGRRVLPG